MSVFSSEHGFFHGMGYDPCRDHICYSSNKIEIVLFPQKNVQFCIKIIAPHQAWIATVSEGTGAHSRTCWTLYKHAPTRHCLRLVNGTMWKTTSSLAATRVIEQPTDSSDVISLCWNGWILTAVREPTWTSPFRFCCGYIGGLWGQDWGEGWGQRALCLMPHRSHSTVSGPSAWSSDPAASACHRSERRCCSSCTARLKPKRQEGVFRKRGSENNCDGRTVDVDSSIQPTMSQQSDIDRYMLKEGGVSNTLWSQCIGPGWNLDNSSG